REFGQALRPAEVRERRARQTEREVEAADPGTGALEPCLQGREIFDGVDPFEPQHLAVEVGGRDGDGLRPARRAGEIDAVDDGRHGPGGHCTSLYTPSHSHSPSRSEISTISTSSPIHGRPWRLSQALRAPAASAPRT